MTSPPQIAIDAALEAARRSPCAKSKRGVAVFTTNNLLEFVQPGLAGVVGVGFNGMPGGARCTGEQCKRVCSKRCVHAEVRALVAAAVHSLTPLSSHEAVHVKVVGGELVAGGGPSCVDCSKLVLDVGLRAFWLYEYGDQSSPLADAFPTPSSWRRYPARQFHALSLAANGLATLCPLCNGLATHHNFGLDPTEVCARCDGQGWVS